MQRTDSVQRKGGRVQEAADFVSGIRIWLWVLAVGTRGDAYVLDGLGNIRRIFGWTASFTHTIQHFPFRLAHRFPTGPLETVEQA